MTRFATDWPTVRAEIEGMRACRVLEFKDEAEWLEYRKGPRVGSSESPALLNLCPPGWGATALRLYSEKTGTAPARVPDEAMIVGKAEEPVVAALAAKRLGLQLITPPPWCCFESIKYPGAFASIDFLTRAAFGDLELLECKTAEFAGVDEWRGADDEYRTPLHVGAQVTQQMAITGIKRANVALKIGRSMPWTFKQAWNEETWQAIYDAIVEFLDDLQQQRPPIPGPADLALLGSLRPPSQPEKIIDLGATGARIFAKWDAARLEHRKAEAVIDECKVAIGELMQDAQVGMVGKRKVTWRIQHRVKEAPPFLRELHSLMLALQDGAVSAKAFTERLPALIEALEPLTHDHVTRPRVMLPPAL